MAKSRMVNTKFWTDDYIINYLNTTDKLAYIYLFTNPYTDICGIYELPLKLMAIETGIDRENLEKVILPKFEKDGKVIYRHGWVAVKNFIKNQSLNPKVQRGIEIGLEKAPKDLIEFTKSNSLSIVYTQPMDSPSHSNSNSNSNPKVIGAKAPRRETEKEEEDWNFTAYVNDMESKERRDFDIITHYWEVKNVAFPSRELAAADLKRCLRAAKLLQPYENDRIVEVMDWLEKNADFPWKLETVLKYIEQDLSKLRTKK